MGKSTLFEKSVLRVVSEIPRGSVLSYGEVARRAGFPGAARAVGTLMKKNHDPNIPCHRVICSDGYVGEYNTGGSMIKMKKLKLEGVSLRGEKVCRKS